MESCGEHLNQSSDWDAHHMIPRILNYEFWRIVNSTWWQFFSLELLYTKKTSPVIETWQIEIKTFLIRKIILGHEVLQGESNKLSCHVIGPDLDICIRISWVMKFLILNLKSFSDRVLSYVLGAPRIHNIYMPRHSSRWHSLWWVLSDNPSIYFLGF